MSEETLDVRGLRCPLPVLRANKVLKTLAPGATLTVLATDAAAPNDFGSFCETTGHTMVDSRSDGDDFVLVIRKKA